VSTTAGYRCRGFCFEQRPRANVKLAGELIRQVTALLFEPFRLAIPVGAAGVNQNPVALPDGEGALRCAIQLLPGWAWKVFVLAARQNAVTVFTGLRRGAPSRAAHVPSNLRDRCFRADRAGRNSLRPPRDEGTRWPPSHASRFTPRNRPCCDARNAGCFVCAGINLNHLRPLSLVKNRSVSWPSRCAPMQTSLRLPSSHLRDKIAVSPA